MTKPYALIIEDNQDLANIFALALQGAKFETEIILDGQTALERLAEITPDLVLLDLHLPRVPGKKILRHIRADERLSETLVVVVTADAQLAQELDMQTDVTLLKPVSPSQLRTLALRLRPPGTVTD